MVRWTLLWLYCFLTDLDEQVVGRVYAICVGLSFALWGLGDMLMLFWTHADLHGLSFHLTPRVVATRVRHAGERMRD